MKKLIAVSFLVACGGASSRALFIQESDKDPQTPANMSCLGSFMDPAAPTDPTTVDMKVEDFETNKAVVGSTVDVFLSLDHANADTPDATSMPTGSDGHTMLVVPPGSYRVIFRTTGADPAKTIQTFEFNRKYNDTARISVSNSTKLEIPALVGHTPPDDTKGVIAGGFHDCDGKETGGVTAEIKSTGGAYPNVDNVFYFVDASGTTIPDRNQEFTTGNGAFAGIDVPPGDVTITATDGSRTLSTAVVPVRANSVTIVELDPLGK